MIAFINDYWQILTTFLAVVAYLYRQIVATRKGVRALLRADIIRLYNKYMMTLNTVLSTLSRR